MSSTEAAEQSSQTEDKIQQRQSAYVPEFRAPTPTHEERSPAQRLAEQIGNRNFNQVVSRMTEGQGILPGGRIHPDVEATIAASKGRGQSLDRALASDLAGGMGTSLDDVRIHTGPAAAALSRAVSARAFTVGSDVFFNEGEYNPGSRAGKELLAHELAHTVQQRGAPASGPLTVSTPGDALEREADSVASELVA